MAEAPGIEWKLTRQIAGQRARMKTSDDTRQDIWPVAPTNDTRHYNALRPYPVYRNAYRMEQGLNLYPAGWAADS